MKLDNFVIFSQFSETFGTQRSRTTYFKPEDTAHRIISWMGNGCFRNIIIFQAIGQSMNEIHARMAA